MMQQNSANILLVGAGPIGLEMAIALKRNNLNYMHIEASCLASTINWYAPGTAFFSSPERLSIAGQKFEVSPHIKATREEYLLYLRNVVTQFKLEINFYRKLDSVITQNGKFSARIKRCAINPNFVRTDIDTELEEDELSIDKIILAIGDMHRPRMIGIKGENGPFVSHYFMDPHILSQLRVTIVGGKNSAAEAAVRLYRAGAKVTIIYRRDKLDPLKVKPWVLPELNALIRERKIKFIPDANPIEIINSKLRIKGNDSRESIIDGDYILLLTGYEQDPNLFNNLGINLNGTTPVLNDFCESSIENIFVIGTAVAGSQTNGATHFIETSHIHINKVLKKLGVTDYPEYFNSIIRPLEDREN